MNLNISSVETQMEEKLPVYISGNRLIPYGKRGHAWVVDGLSQIANYSTTQYSCLYQGENVGYIPVRTVNYYRDQKYFHCNWGWNGKDNGWYLEGVFNPGSYDYKYDLKMLTDIR